MNIMLVAQCSKQALPATRRILDQFAERKGHRTWLTPITAEGLKTLHQLLRQSARRNTAVACHWIHGDRIDLVWIVGDRRKFNFDGTVPTNHTKRDVIGHYQEEGWRHTESVALMASIAGLFHDFGKANELFQIKLTASIEGKVVAKSEPIRHEWLSARLFEAFVGEDADAVWLQRLVEVGNNTGEELIDNAVKDGLGRLERNSFLYKLRERPVAWAVIWLILTHHRLPYSVDPANSYVSKSEKWERRLTPVWNSPQYNPNDNVSQLTKLWRFPYGLPCASSTWRKRAKTLGYRAIKHPGLLNEDWRNSTFVIHMARCALMLADHYYSSHEATTDWQAIDYSALANTRKSDPDTVKRSAHQKLDEHCIGVSHHAYLIAKSLPGFSTLLPAISDVRALKKRAPSKFRWQDKAYSMALQMREKSDTRGGFIVNMASTGTGKTIANARIAYGLANARLGCRFSVLLGLRTLTLQTGDALRVRTGLDKGELAVLVGSSSVRTLHEQKNLSNDVLERTGSESEEPFFSEHEYIVYDGSLEQSRVGRWLGTQRGGASLKTLLSAPVLVSTIDRLIPATESARGGHQIAPMLRLLSADTVFDEPDDFGLKDLPALCRIVHWAGLLGSRVIFSSATLSPSLLKALFSAYRSGRSEFNLATNGKNESISCGWVDEFSASTQQIGCIDKFTIAHETFVQKRLSKLGNSKKFPRRAEIVPVCEDGEEFSRAYAITLLKQVETLHSRHALQSPDGSKRLSVGLVRMANIDPLVAVVKKLVQLTPTLGVRWHICVYHSRHPLYRRSSIEGSLDRVLSRQQPSVFWQHKEIKFILDNPEPDQIMIVLATDVATTGRDHHYDWSIIEPSSVRSIIQIAGRVMRHHGDTVCDLANIFLLQKNVRALRRIEHAFSRPGYESADWPLQSHLLDEILDECEYEIPSSAPSIVQRSSLQPSQRFVDLEHAATMHQLFGFVPKGVDDQSEMPSANTWWESNVRWGYQLQYLTRFRKSAPEAVYALIADDPNEGAIFKQPPVNFKNDWKAVESQFNRIELSSNERMQPWLACTDHELLQRLSEEFPEMPMWLACQRFMGISLSTFSEATRWNYHPWLGVFSEIE